MTEEGQEHGRTEDEPQIEEVEPAGSPWATYRVP
jgi:hypothetical protein